MPAEGTQQPYLVHALLCIGAVGRHEQRAVPEGTRPDLRPATHDSEQRAGAEQRGDRWRLHSARAWIDPVL